jgi:methylated-DNA-[protein]-cysteine S-methyltransferase
MMMKALATDIFSAIVPAPFGAIGIRSSGDVLHELTYLPPQYKVKLATDKLSKKIATQVAAYLKYVLHRARSGRLVVLTGTH